MEVRSLEDFDADVDEIERGEELLGRAIAAGIYLGGERCVSMARCPPLRLKTDVIQNELNDFGKARPSADALASGTPATADGQHIWKQSGGTLG